MAPEEVYSLVAISLHLEDGRLIADGERVDLGIDPLYVSWYATAPAPDQVSIVDGLVHVSTDPRLKRSEIRSAVLTATGKEYVWRNPPTRGGPLMFATSLPAGYTLSGSEPKPVEAKDHNGKLALFWIMPPEAQVQLKLRLEKLDSALVDEVQRINREGLDQLLPTRWGGFKYDVALSFAGEDREYVEVVAEELRNAGVKVFYDRFEEVSLWGKNLYDHLSDVYSRQARYTVMFISQHYAKKLWTTHERQSAQARAFEENSDSILPARFDDTKVPGLPSTIGYLSLHNRDPKALARLIVEKIRSSESSTTIEASESPTMEEEPGILDLRVRQDEAFESATSAIREIAALVSQWANADREWTAKIQAASVRGVSPKQAHTAINLQAAELGRRSKALRDLRATFRASSDEFFGALTDLVEFQIAKGFSSADEMKAGLAHVVKADSTVRAARETYATVAASLGNLPDHLTREFRVQKRGLAQQVENLSADIGSWLDRSKELRSRFELGDSVNLPVDPS